MRTSFLRKRVQVSEGKTYLGVNSEALRQVAQTASYEMLHRCESFCPHIEVGVPSFEIDKYQVTCKEFLDWIHSVNLACSPIREHDLSYWRKFESEVDFCDDAPIVGVTWSEAMAFCWSIGGRLPYEAELIRATRGDNNCLHLWDDTRTEIIDLCLFEEERFQVRRSVFDSQESWCGVSGLMGLCDEHTCTPFIWSATTERAFFEPTMTIPDRLRREAARFGRDFVVMETLPEEGFLVIGKRGSVAPFLTAGGNGDPEISTRISTVGFRCAYDYDSDGV